MKTAANVLKYTKDLNLHSENSVLVGGCFDLVHYGHLMFLKAAKREGDTLVVALEGDDYIRSHKSRKPIHTQKQRAELLAELNVVDVVLELPLFKSDEDYFGMVRKVKPAVIAITEGDPQAGNKLKQADMIGAKLVAVVPLIKDFSTTNILKHASISRD